MAPSRNLEKDLEKSFTGKSSEVYKLEFSVNFRGEVNEILKKYVQENSLKTTDNNFFEIPKSLGQNIPNSLANLWSEMSIAGYLNRFLKSIEETEQKIHTQLKGFADQNSKYTQLDPKTELLKSGDLLLYVIYKICKNNETLSKARRCYL